MNECAETTCTLSSVSSEIRNFRPAKQGESLAQPLPSASSERNGRNPFRPVVWAKMQCLYLRLKYLPSGTALCSRGVLTCCNHFSCSTPASNQRKTGGRLLNRDINTQNNYITNIMYRYRYVYRPGMVVLGLKYMPQPVWNLFFVQKRFPPEQLDGSSCLFAAFCTYFGKKR